MDVVGLGFTSLDSIGIVPHLPSVDESVLLHDFTRQGGGPAAQALVTLARLGASVGFVGRVGNDEAGQEMQRSLHTEGVDVSRLQIEPGATSAQCIILVDRPTGKRSICCHPGTVSALSSTELDLPYLCSGRFLHLDGHAPDAALVAARAARAAGIKVCLDAGGPGPHLEALVRLTDVLIAAERFVVSVTNGGYQAAAAHLLDLGPEVVVVTRGEHGSYTRTRDAELRQEAFQVPVVDTTGAGDVFHGAYLFGLLQNWDLLTTARFAGATAALKCTRLGGRAGIPRRDEVMTFLQAHDAWVSTPA
jgi:sulfofructose kinase